MKRIELEVWEPTPDDPRRSQYVRQRTAREVFGELGYRLDSMGYLPDEYFLVDAHWQDGREIPKGADVFCTVDYGGSEGIYLDVYLKWYDEQQKKSVTQSLATGKTLGESGADMDRMHLISSAVVKAFHSDGEHTRYMQLGEPGKAEVAILHLTGAEQRLFIDSLAARRSMLLNDTLETEQLLRRVTGSVIEFVNEVGARPMRISDHDMAVLAIQDGAPDSLREIIQRIPDHIGELLPLAAGRPGNVGKSMTAILLVGSKDIPQDMYLTACKNAVKTGDTERVLMLAHDAEAHVRKLDMSLYGKVILEALPEHKNIAEALVKQCAREQLAASDPRLLTEVLSRGDLNMAQTLIKSGIDANTNAPDNIRALTWRTDNRFFFKYLLEAGMRIDSGNFSALRACIDSDNPEAAKLLLDQGMDFDGYTKWAEGRVQLPPGETLDAVREHWESRGQEPGLEPTIG